MLYALGGPGTGRSVAPVDQLEGIRRIMIEERFLGMDKNSLEKIRNQLSAEAVEVVSAILDYFLENDEWIPVRALHIQFSGKEKARRILGYNPNFSINKASNSSSIGILMTGVCPRHTCTHEVM